MWPLYSRIFTTDFISTNYKLKIKFLTIVPITIGKCLYLLPRNGRTSWIFMYLNDNFFRYSRQRNVRSNVIYIFSIIDSNKQVITDFFEICIFFKSQIICSRIFFMHVCNTGTLDTNGCIFLLKNYWCKVLFKIIMKQIDF